jgi:DNA-directed RNA polymerase subunit H (RpoH/RPB5)
MTPSTARRSRARPAVPKTTVPRPFVAHHLAPPHEILTEEESRKVMEEIGVSPERLPKILVTDPGLKTDPKYDGLKEKAEPLVGRLVRVHRPSATAGDAVAYRLIVPSLGGD